MAYWHINPWMKWISPSVTWDLRSKEKIIYLTFDDGPTPVVTEKVLDLLDRYDAKATFFCLGRNVERHQEIYKTILERGHATGNHTYSHLKGWKTPNGEYLSDIELARQHIPSKLFRPPYGQIRRSQIRLLRNVYKIVMWDVMSHDYEQRLSKELSLRALLKYIKPGSIVVFHDSVKAWPKLEYILPQILDYFSSKGFEFHHLKMLDNTGEMSSS